MIYYDFVGIVCCLLFPVSVMYVLCATDKALKVPKIVHFFGVLSIITIATGSIILSSSKGEVTRKCPVIHMDNNSYAYVSDLKKFLNLNESTKENWDGEEFAWVSVSNRISDNGIVIYSEREVEVKRLTPDEKRIHNDQTTN